MLFFTKVPVLSAAEPVEQTWNEESRLILAQSKHVYRYCAFISDASLMLALKVALVASRD